MGDVPQVVGQRACVARPRCHRRPVDCLPVCHRRAGGRCVCS